MKRLCLALWVMAAGWPTLAQTPPPGTSEGGAPLRLRLAGSPVYGSGAEAKATTAVLFLDTTSIDGKSGLVRLHKGLTVAHLVVSSREMTCERVGEFDKKAFLQRNLIPLPKLPDLSTADDYVVTIGVLGGFDPREHKTSILYGALTGLNAPIEDLLALVFAGRSTVAPPPSGTRGLSIHLHTTTATVHTVSRHDKPYVMNAPAPRTSAAAFAISDGAVHILPPQERPPFDPAAVMLSGDGEAMSATFDIRWKDMDLIGHVPVRLCTPVERTIDEYPNKK